jgi:hypothetical protein
VSHPALNDPPAATAAGGFCSLFVSAILVGMADGPQFRRRWRAPRVLGLVAILLVYLLPCCWLAVKRHQASPQREAVAAIRKVGSVRYGPSRVPAWLRNVVGDDCFAQVSEMSFGRETTDVDLECLRSLRDVLVLGLNGTKITDAGLDHVDGLTRLGALHLRGTKITDAGLQHLRGLQQLMTLDLGINKLTDAGLENLRGLVQLKFLMLDNTKISDIGLEHLRRLTQLQELSLSGTLITDASLEQLKALPLQSLDVRGTAVTQDGIRKFEAAMPGCRVAR